MSKKQKSAPLNIVPDEILDQLLDGYKNPEDITGPNGIIKQLTKRLIEKVMQQELTHHLGYSKNSKVGDNSGNSRNGYSEKTIKTDRGEISIETPRDRKGDFEPTIIPKGSRQFKGFDDLILSLYTNGMTTRDIQEHIQMLYNVEVSPDFVSNVTDGILSDIKEWQTRALDKVYPFVYLDAIRIKTREEGHILNKAVYVVLGVNMEGHKEVLGLWFQETEGAKFWMRVLTELKNRGVEDILIAVVDGLKGFPEAIKSIYPNTEVQICVVHMIRGSLKYVPYKERKTVASDLKLIYGAATLEKAEYELENFGKKWHSKYPTIHKMWSDNWESISTYFAYSPAIRKVIYTTNAIESLNYSFRKITKTRGSFPTDEAATKLLYLAIKKVSKKWTMPIREWGIAINQLAIIFGDRVPIYEAGK